MLTIDRPHCAGRPTISKVRIHVNTTGRCLRDCGTKFVGSSVSNTYSIFANVWRSLAFRCYRRFLFSQRFLQAVLSPASSSYRGAATVFSRCPCSNIFPRRICIFHEVNLHFVRNIGTSLSTGTGHDSSDGTNARPKIIPNLRLSQPQRCTRLGLKPEAWWRLGLGLQASRIEY
ncbi:hypothetical protein ARMGADRAFT_615127 [Armillaria gallica]|uniref:Uncharacterized protein n=1 Tax=Armillaria gallica TaxID=47427 RepID=A0A2H3CS48_ARMGA|nr:hypothetical protein ARMGADRAFT_615127 [Armillaria gallica]